MKFVKWFAVALLAGIIAWAIYTNWEERRIQAALELYHSQIPDSILSDSPGCCGVPDTLVVDSVVFHGGSVNDLDDNGN